MGDALQKCGVETFVVFQRQKSSIGTFAVGIDEDLVFGGAVVLIEKDGGIDAEGFLHSTLDPGPIALLNGFALEGTLEKALRLLVAAGQQEAGGLLVYAVDGVGVLAAVITHLVEHGVGGAHLFGVDQDAAGFVEEVEVGGTENGTVPPVFGFEPDHLHVATDPGGFVGKRLPVAEQASPVDDTLSLPLADAEGLHEPDESQGLLFEMKAFEDEGHSPLLNGVLSRILAKKQRIGVLEEGFPSLNEIPVC